MKKVFTIIALFMVAGMLGQAGEKYSVIQLVPRVNPPSNATWGDGSFYVDSNDVLYIKRNGIWEPVVTESADFPDFEVTAPDSLDYIAYDGTNWKNRKFDLGSVDGITNSGEFRYWVNEPEYDTPRDTLTSYNLREQVWTTREVYIDSVLSVSAAYLAFWRRHGLIIGAKPDRPHFTFGDYTRNYTTFSGGPRNVGVDMTMVNIDPARDSVDRRTYGRIRVNDTLGVTRTQIDGLGNIDLQGDYKINGLPIAINSGSEININTDFILEDSHANRIIAVNTTDSVIVTINADSISAPSYIKFHNKGSGFIGIRQGSISYLSGEYKTSNGPGEYLSIYYPHPDSAYVQSPSGLIAYSPGPPVFQNQWTNQVGSGETITVTAAPTTGRYLVAQATINDVDMVYNDPSGWTRIAESNGGGMSAATWIKVSDGSETSITINGTGSNTGAYIASVYEFSGVSGYESVLEDEGGGGGRSTATIPAITSTSNNSLGLAIIYKNFSSSDNFTDTPSPYTRDGINTTASGDGGSDDAVIFLYSSELTSAGTITADDITFSNSNGIGIVALFLNAN